LRLLLQSGSITAEAYDLGVSTLTPIQTVGGQLPQVAPDFAVYARRQAVDILNSLGRDGARLVSRGGVRITTTLDLDLYYQSECLLRTQLARLRGDTTPQNALDGSACTAATYLPRSEERRVGKACRSRLRWAAWE